MSYDWVFTKINRLIESPPKGFNFDANCLFLTNPKTEQIIDEIFFYAFLPKIEKVFEKSNFAIFETKDYPHFEKKFSVRLVKKFVIVIDDPKRPFRPGEMEKIWFTRFELELSISDYMLSTDFILNLPEKFELQKIIQLLKNPYFQGLPPDLSYDGNTYTLSFHTGKGAGWGLESYDEAATIVSEKIQKIYKLLNFLNDNEDKLSAENNYFKLENLLVNYFQNW